VVAVVLGDNVVDSMWIGVAGGAGGKVVFGVGGAVGVGVGGSWCCRWCCCVSC